MPAYAHSHSTMEGIRLKSNARKSTHSGRLNPGDQGQLRLRQNERWRLGQKQDSNCNMSAHQKMPHTPSAVKRSGWSLSARAHSDDRPEDDLLTPMVVHESKESVVTNGVSCTGKPEGSSVNGVSQLEKKSPDQRSLWSLFSTPKLPEKRENESVTLEDSPRAHNSSSSSSEETPPKAQRTAGLNSSRTNAGDATIRPSRNLFVKIKPLQKSRNFFANFSKSVDATSRLANEDTTDTSREVCEKGKVQNTSETRECMREAQELEHNSILSSSNERTRNSTPDIRATINEKDALHHKEGCALDDQQRTTDQSEESRELSSNMKNIISADTEVDPDDVHGKTNLLATDVESPQMSSHKHSNENLSETSSDMDESDCLFIDEQELPTTEPISPSMKEDHDGGHVLRVWSLQSNGGDSESALPVPDSSECSSSHGGISQTEETCAMNCNEMTDTFKDMICTDQNLILGDDCEQNKLQVRTDRIVTSEESQTEDGVLSISSSSVEPSATKKPLQESGSVLKNEEVQYNADHPAVPSVLVDDESRTIVEESVDSKTDASFPVMEAESLQENREIRDHDDHSSTNSLLGEDDASLVERSDTSNMVAPVRNIFNLFGEKKCPASTNNSEDANPESVAAAAPEETEFSTDEPSVQANDPEKLCLSSSHESLPSHTDDTTTVLDTTREINAAQESNESSSLQVSECDIQNIPALASSTDVPSSVEPGVYLDKLPPCLMPEKDTVQTMEHEDDQIDDLSFFSFDDKEALMLFSKKMKVKMQRKSQNNVAKMSLQKPAFKAVKKKQKLSLETTLKAVKKTDFPGSSIKAPEKRDHQEARVKVVQGKESLDEKVRELERKFLWSMDILGLTEIVHPSLKKRGIHLKEIKTSNVRVKLKDDDLRSGPRNIKHQSKPRTTLEVKAAGCPSKAAEAFITKQSSCTKAPERQEWEVCPGGSVQQSDRPSLKLKFINKAKSSSSSPVQQSPFVLSTKPKSCPLPSSSTTSQVHVNVQQLHLSTATASQPALKHDQQPCPLIPAQPHPKWKSVSKTPPQPSSKSKNDVEPNQGPQSCTSLADEAKPDIVHSQSSTRLPEEESLPFKPFEKPVVSKKSAFVSDALEDMLEGASKSSQGAALITPASVAANAARVVFKVPSKQSHAVKTLEMALKRQKTVDISARREKTHKLSVTGYNEGHTHKKKKKHKHKKDRHKKDTRKEELSPTKFSEHGMLSSEPLPPEGYAFGTGPDNLVKKLPKLPFTFYGKSLPGPLFPKPERETKQENKGKGALGVENVSGSTTKLKQEEADDVGNENGKQPFSATLPHAEISNSSSKQKIKREAEDIGNEDSGREGKIPRKCQDFCVLGCICDCLASPKSIQEMTVHCRKEDCMFTCHCSHTSSLGTCRIRKPPSSKGDMMFYDRTYQLWNLAEKDSAPPQKRIRLLDFLPSCEKKALQNSCARTRQFESDKIKASTERKGTDRHRRMVSNGHLSHHEVSTSLHATHKPEPTAEEEKQRRRIKMKLKHNSEKRFIPFSEMCPSTKTSNNEKITSKCSSTVVTTAIPSSSGNNSSASIVPVAKQYVLGNLIMNLIVLPNGNQVLVPAQSLGSFVINRGNPIPSSSGASVPSQIFSSSSASSVKVAVSQSATPTVPAGRLSFRTVSTVSARKGDLVTKHNLSNTKSTQLKFHDYRPKSLSQTVSTMQQDDGKIDAPQISGSGLSMNYKVMFDRMKDKYQISAVSQSTPMHRDFSSSRIIPIPLPTSTQGGLSKISVNLSSQANKTAQRSSETLQKSSHSVSKSGRDQHDWDEKKGGLTSSNCSNKGLSFTHAEKSDSEACMSNSAAKVTDKLSAPLPVPRVSCIRDSGVMGTEIKRKNTKLPGVQAAHGIDSSATLTNYPSMLLTKSQVLEPVPSIRDSVTMGTDIARKSTTMPGVQAVHGVDSSATLTDCASSLLTKSQTTSTKGISNTSPSKMASGQQLPAIRRSPMTCIMIMTGSGMKNPVKVTLNSTCEWELDKNNILKAIVGLLRKDKGSLKADVNNFRIHVIERSENEGTFLVTPKPEELTEQPERPNACESLNQGSKGDMAKMQSASSAVINKSSDEITPKALHHTHVNANGNKKEEDKYSPQQVDIACGTLSSVMSDKPKEKEQLPGTNRKEQVIGMSQMDNATIHGSGKLSSSLPEFAKLSEIVKKSSEEPISIDIGKSKMGVLQSHDWVEDLTSRQKTSVASYSRVREPWFKSGNSSEGVKVVLERNKTKKHSPWKSFPSKLSTGTSPKNTCITKSLQCDEVIPVDSDSDEDTKVKGIDICSRKNLQILQDSGYSSEGQKQTASSKDSGSSCISSTGHMKDHQLEAVDKSHMGPEEGCFTSLKSSPQELSDKNSNGEKESRKEISDICTSRSVVTAEHCSSDGETCQTDTGGGCTGVDVVARPEETECEQLSTVVDLSNESASPVGMHTKQLVETSGPEHSDVIHDAQREKQCSVHSETMLPPPASLMESRDDTHEGEDAEDGTFSIEHFAQFSEEDPVFPFAEISDGEGPPAENSPVKREGNSTCCEEASSLTDGRISELNKPEQTSPETIGAGIPRTSLCSNVDTKVLNSSIATENEQEAYDGIRTGTCDTDINRSYTNIVSSREHNAVLTGDAVTQEASITLPKQSSSQSDREFSLADQAIKSTLRSASPVNFSPSIETQSSSENIELDVINSDGEIDVEHLSEADKLLKSCKTSTHPGLSNLCYLTFRLKKSLGEIGKSKLKKKSPKKAKQMDMASSHTSIPSQKESMPNQTFHHSHSETSKKKKGSKRKSPVEPSKQWLSPMFEETYTSYPGGFKKKRKQHNVLERKRREQLKDFFKRLAKVTEVEESSAKIRILCEATNKIKELETRSKALEREKEALKKKRCRLAYVHSNLMHQARVIGNVPFLGGTEDSVGKVLRHQVESRNGDGILAENAAEPMEENNAIDDLSDAESLPIACYVSSSDESEKVDDALDPMSEEGVYSDDGFILASDDDWNKQKVDDGDRSDADGLDKDEMDVDLSEKTGSDKDETSDDVILIETSEDEEEDDQLESRGKINKESVNVERGGSKGEDKVEENNAEEKQHKSEELDRTFEKAKGVPLLTGDIAGKEPPPQLESTAKCLEKQPKIVNVIDQIIERLAIDTASPVEDAENQHKADTSNSKVTSADSHVTKKSGKVEGSTKSAQPALKTSEGSSVLQGDVCQLSLLHGSRDSDQQAVNKEGSSRPQIFDSIDSPPSSPVVTNNSRKDESARDRDSRQENVGDSEKVDVSVKGGLSDLISNITTRIGTKDASSGDSSCDESGADVPSVQDQKIASVEEEANRADREEDEYLADEEDVDEDGDTSEDSSDDSSSEEEGVMNGSAGDRLNANKCVTDPRKERNDSEASTEQRGTSDFKQKRSVPQEPIEESVDFDDSSSISSVEMDLASDDCYIIDDSDDAAASNKSPSVRPTSQCQMEAENSCNQSKPQQSVILVDDLEEVAAPSKDTAPGGKKGIISSSRGSGSRRESIASSDSSSEALSDVAQDRAPGGSRSAGDAAGVDPVLDEDISFLDVEKNSDGTLNVVLKGDYDDQKLDELFEKPGVMDYLMSAAAKKQL